MRLFVTAAQPPLTNTFSTHVPIKLKACGEKGSQSALPPCFVPPFLPSALLTLCGKSNVLTYVFDLWNRSIEAIAPEYPEVKVNYCNVDAICMWMVKNPEWFDVIVTTNMFGDIITDLAAMTQGGMGIAAGGNLNPEGISMFEPIGGSAPKYTGKNVINPLAAILAGAMMLDHLGEKEAANAIEKSVAYLTENKIKSLSAGKMGYSTTEVGDMVAAGL